MSYTSNSIVTMLKEKKSFFERLAGSMNVTEEENYIDVEEEGEDEEELSVKHKNRKGRDEPLYDERAPTRRPHTIEEEEDEIPEEEGELSVDVYQTQSEIIIEAMVAGVKPEDLHLSITRDMITIKGRRNYPNPAR